MKNVVTQLRCNGCINPIGIDDISPLLSWKIEGNKNIRDEMMAEIVVGTSLDKLTPDKADCWISGPIVSPQGQMVYQGKPLISRQRVYWKVRVLLDHGQWSLWSEPSFWEMGLLSSQDWSAKWIGTDEGRYNPSRKLPVPAPLFRRVFRVPSKVICARVYVSGLGYYELSLDGRKVGDPNELLSPPLSAYDRTVYYQTYDVTEDLIPGDHVIGCILGNGLYFPQHEDEWHFFYSSWKDRPRLLFQLEFVLEDGSFHQVISDLSWRWHDTPIVRNNLRTGEMYDARQEIAGWERPDYSVEANGWRPVKVVLPPGGTLRATNLPPIRKIETLKPQRFYRIGKNKWIFDFGRNIAGIPHLKIKGEVGQEIILRHGEQLNPDGTVDLSKIGCFVKGEDFQTDRYILKGDPQGEEWEPRFTYHGFQYIEADGLPPTIQGDEVTAIRVHTDLQPRGSITMSWDLLQRIQNAAVASTLGNFHSIPTDCPHREKNGWTGDAHLSAEQALLNLEIEYAYHKWMQDFLDAQRPCGSLPGYIPSGPWGFTWGNGPAWDSAIILIPWYTYVYRNDRKILSLTYEGMKRYLLLLEHMEIEPGIIDFGLGDWCPPIGYADAYRCPTRVTDTAYYYRDAVLMTRIAQILHQQDDLFYFQRIVKRVREAFRSHFLYPEIYDVEGSSQTAVACALYQGLITPEEAPLYMKTLLRYLEEKNWHLDTGILGAKYVMQSLRRYGYGHLAWRIAMQEDFPSWGYWIRLGATTLWENWDGRPSRNHHMYSDISAWFYRSLVGINPDWQLPGFRHLYLAPQPPLSDGSVEAWHDSPHGKIAVAWEVRNQVFYLHFETPPRVYTTLKIPPLTVSGTEVLNQKPISSSVISFLPSGQYTFTCRLHDPEK